MASASRKRQITLRIDEEICALAEHVAAAKGIGLVEYIRFLVIDDLDSRHLLDDRVMKH